MSRKVFYLFSLAALSMVMLTTIMQVDANAQGRSRDRDRYDRRDDRRDDRYDRRDDRRDDRYTYERRYSRRDIGAVISRAEASSKVFRREIDRELDRSRLDGSRREDRINDEVRQFENAMTRLRREFDRNDSWWETRRDVEQALNAAREVGVRVRNNRFSGSVENQWRNLRRDLNTMANRYNLPDVP